MIGIIGRNKIDVTRCDYSFQGSTKLTIVCKKIYQKKLKVTILSIRSLLANTLYGVKSAVHVLCACMCVYVCMWYVQMQIHMHAEVPVIGTPENPYFLFTSQISFTVLLGPRQTGSTIKPCSYFCNNQIQITTPY